MCESRMRESMRTSGIVMRFGGQKHTLHNYRVHSEGFCLHPTLRLDHIDGVTFNTTVTPMIAALSRPSATVFAQLVTTLQ